MKLKAIFSAALAAVVMATTAMGASALDATTDDIRYVQGVAGVYYWKNLEFFEDDGYEISVTWNDEYDRSEVTEIIIPETINGKSVIKIYNFQNLTNLKSIIIPDGVTNLAGTFKGCTSLTSITIPDSVTYIGLDSFLNCQDLTDIYYTGTEEQWNKITTVAGVKFSNFKEAISNATVHFNSKAPDTDPDKDNSGSDNTSSDTSTSDTTSDDTSTSDTTSDDTSTSDTTSDDTSTSDNTSNNSSTSTSTNGDTSTSSSTSSGSSENNNPPTGAAGIALTFGAVAAGAAIVVSRKRK